ncbi:SEC-C domain-containing protein [Eubacteriales bacterium OttesenSCG-928-N13]|nr:SEC-C domain-containing protein [Eubacteriales bacterium OttesenSCG-928-N13]
MPSALLQRRVEIQRILRKKVGRNDLCPCQSGLKYKQCCGKYYA